MGKTQASETVRADSAGASADCDLLESDLNATEQRRRALYALFAAHDARVDGHVFVGVSSTRIYCRPVCHARLPKFENCTFFRTAAEAEASGYRPCLLCRPELAPGCSAADANGNLARRAAALLRERCSSGESMETLSLSLGYTSRHVRRAFEAEFGVSPLSYLQTCRLLLAKGLLTDTRLPVAQVARAAGFSSTRRFNYLFKERYRLTPTQLRRRGASGGDVDSGVVTIHLSYRAPYRFDRLLDFFRARRLEGVEAITDATYARAVRLPGAAADGGDLVGWIEVENDEPKHRLRVRMAEALLPAISTVAARVRRQFDTDADPDTLLERLASLDDLVPGANVAGTRVPGAFDPFEIAVRAVLGQQISVKAANKLAARIAEMYGTPVDTPIEGVARLFPTAADFLALDPIEDALGTLGVIKTRSRTIREIARLVAEGELNFGPAAEAGEQMKRLLAIKGIGPWSANYIAMRALGYTDAFLETDVGVAHALPGLTPRERLIAAESWRPWRAYANLCLWNSLG